MLTDTLGDNIKEANMCDARVYLRSNWECQRITKLIYELEESILFKSPFQKHLQTEHNFS